MLSRINIKNFALIENLELELTEGLNVLTGETGAGKSIIIDAMGIITGTAAQHEYIRTGEDKALVEAMFDISDTPAAKEKALELGVEAEDDMLLLTRELQRSGKNLCRINGRPVTLAMYRELGQLLVDIYGQNHHQSLLSRDKHLTLLDSFGGTKIRSELSRLGEIVNEYLKLAQKLSVLERDEAEKARLMDLYNFQVSEIEDANLRINEEEELKEEQNLLVHAEKLAELSKGVYGRLYTGTVTGEPVLDLLHKILLDLKELSEIDSSLGTVTGQFEESLYQIEDCALQIGRYKENINHDPHRLNDVGERLERIKSLQKKYGASISEILSFKEEVAASLNELIHSEEEISRVKLKLEVLQKQYYNMAAKLSVNRKAVAKVIEESICGELQQLNMPQVTFSVEFHEKEQICSSGYDEVEFMITPNPGEPLKPLAKIASGGEISRIMLAMKTILAKFDEIPTLIFDEIDAGLGGRAVQSVARKLAFIGRNRQVICVTHSAHIACYADTHYHIFKESAGGRTITTIMGLAGEERVTEIARMIGGDHITATARENAQELLELAKKS